MQHCAWYKQEEALAGLRGPEGRRGNSQVFDKVGVRILQDFRNADLLIMDELGTMENKALAFQQAVLKALDRDTPILGVIKRDQTPFLEAVRHHPAVRTLEITPENRINRLAEADALVSRSVSAFRTSQSRPSCGAVVLRKKDGAWETLLINCRQGHWSFPKGHQEAGETEEDTARREILEETGKLSVSLPTIFQGRQSPRKMRLARSPGYPCMKRPEWQPSILRTLRYFLTPSHT
jgi:8-oxo-dGTP pyrophosphatase MutT (NUDIX family)